ncbi:MAG: ABC transporter permease, partial [Eubacteriales bacterium]|nr:ABC transporter permease [Eubacteriales bacterium]
MRPSDFIRTGIINLSRRRVRTSLTALSMAIGVMCILMLVSVGIGYEQAYRESIEAMGSLTKIDVTQKNGSNGKIAILNKKAVAAFKGIDGVEAVTPVLQSTAYLKSGKYITMVKLYGIDMDTAACFGIAPIEGELPKKGTRLMPELMATDDLAASFAEPDTWKEAIDRNGKPLIDLMRANVKMTFDYASLVGDYTEGEDGRAVPLGQSLRASVTGICSAMNYTYSCSAFLHMDTLKAIAGNSNAAADKNAAEYPLVWVKVGDADDVMEIASLIRSAGFETYSLT